MTALSEYANFKNGKKRPDEEGRYPVYGGNGILGYASSYNMERGVIIGRVGAYCGSVYYESRKCWVSDNAIKAEARTNADLKYLYYLLSSLQLNKRHIGTSQPLLTQGILNDIEVEVPEKKIQEKIAAILSSLDDKIVVNEEINKNLEEQARALMMDYCGRVYNTAPLGTVMSFINGFAFKSSTYLSSGKYKIITIKNVQDGQIETQGTPYIDTIPTQMKPECSLQIGDVLLSLTGNVGRVGIVCEENLLLNQRVAKIQPIDRKILPFLYFYYRLPETKARLETIAKGTAQANLSPIETLKLEFPFNQVLMNTLSCLLSRMFLIIQNNQIQNLVLAETRNALLPHLMSGEIDVSNIDL
jgi:type I restriction enzyme S subunit